MSYVIVKNKTLTYQAFADHEGTVHRLERLGKKGDALKIQLPQHPQDKNSAVRRFMGTQKNPDLFVVFSKDIDMPETKPTVSVANQHDAATLRAAEFKKDQDVKRRNDRLTEVNLIRAKTLAQLQAGKSVQEAEDLTKEDAEAIKAAVARREPKTPEEAIEQLTTQSSNALGYEALMKTPQADLVKIAKVDLGLDVKGNASKKHLVTEILKAAKDLEDEEVEEVNTSENEKEADA